MNRRVRYDNFIKEISSPILNKPVILFKHTTNVIAY